VIWTALPELLLAGSARPDLAAVPVLAESYLRPYLPLAIFGVLVVGTGAAMLGLSRLAGPRRPSRAKAEPYECGVPLFSDARRQFSVKFYLVAILFVLFDIESLFLIPWAVSYRSLGFAAMLEMLFFVAVLVLGFAYAWKRGGLEWD